MQSTGSLLCYVAYYRFTKHVFCIPGKMSPLNVIFVKPSWTQLQSLLLYYKFIFRCEFCPIHSLRSMKQNREDGSKVSSYLYRFYCSGHISLVLCLCRVFQWILATRSTHQKTILNCLSASACFVKHVKGQ